jgi:C4-dicarboxylate transporter, DctM subunit
MSRSPGFIGGLFAVVDTVVYGVRDGVKNGWRNLVNGPLRGLAIALIIGVTGLVVILEQLFSLLDRLVDRLERVLIFIAMFGMTFLAFNEYLQREVFTPGPDSAWAIEGQMNFALLLMVVVGFMGASIATRERGHIAVDAMDRVLSPNAARSVRRLTNLIAAGLCWKFTTGSWHAVFTHSQDTFEGAKVWWWLVAPINWATSLVPGEKFGPGTPYPGVGDWEDAMFDKGVEWDALPAAFQMVEAGERFPLWIPLMLLAFTFCVMSFRFLGHALYPPIPVFSKSRGVKTTRRVVDVVLAGAFPGALIAMGLGAWLGQGVLIVLASVLIVFLGAPLFVAVGVGTLASWVLLRDGSSETVISDMFEATKKQELLAIPFFVLAGNLMTRGSIAERLIELARSAVGWLPGGLGVCAVLACAFFAAISGSSPVTVIAIGSILFPMLIAEGYDEKYSIGVLTTAGGLGIIIPPSIPMIVYAIVVGGNPAVGAIDPATLFKAGILPGLFIASVLILYTLYMNWPRPGATTEKSPAAPPTEDKASIALGTILVRGLPSLMLPVLILGGIYGWLDFSPLGLDVAIRFTVTEAAAVAVVYALFVELIINRELKLKDLPSVVSESAVMMGSLFLILVIAISLNRFFVFEQVPDRATAWMLSHVDSQLTFLIMVNLFLLALGCVMDILSAILIVAPLLAPIAASYGINPIHFGIMFIVNLELGYLTPPLGINLFVATTVFDRPLIDVIRSVIPFLCLMLFCLFVIIWFPSLSLFLVE